ncbi:MAG TPA: hypothetical protein DHV62_10980 [Elusimicrobia bacterium]|jgi:hypothetical protein|nr:hypothetical protein [Elusimicrobiota bacterium]
MSKEKFVDLHIHSYHSDGLLSPGEIVNYASKRNLTAIAIADHDTTSGIPEAIEEGKKVNIEIVSAVELSAEIENSIGDKSSLKSKEIHILGYYIDWKDIAFQEKLHFFRQKRKERARLIYEKLVKLGIKLNPEILENISKEERSFGRLHFARALIKEGYVSNITEAFQLYLDYGKPAYVKKICFKPKEAIELIIHLGGIPILAHPYFTALEEIISPLVSFGLRGIEVWHSKHSSSHNWRLISLAKKQGLLMTGGSDFHGEMDKKTSLIGSLKIPYSVLKEMKQCLPGKDILRSLPEVINQVES